ncbi:MAG: hypothetical protein IT168_29690 [Bryobacterales bacterium]|nr:hypothetical protein [Bryobacterales bacterium]
MLRDLELIVRLQSLDLRVAELRREIAALPKEIAIIEKALDSHQRKLDADRAVVSGNQKERRQLDSDVQMHQQKISKLRDQMSSAKTNEQFRAFQNEIDFVQQQIKKCEDRTLELMEELEGLDKNVKTAEASLKVEREKVDGRKKEAQARTAEAQQHLARLLGERKDIAKEVTPSALGTYERIAKRHNGVAVSEAANGRCTACQLQIRLQLYQDLRKGDRLINCENCNRILHYNPAVAFDTANSGPAEFGSGKRVDMT